MPVSFAGLTLAALPLALSLEGITNGLTRPFFGWVSDYIGRENTMFVAFSLEGMAKLLMIRFAHNPVLFVLFSGLIFFAWGEIYSLFPAISCDLFGRRYATTNYGLLYTAKGVSALFIPIGSLLRAATGGWQTILVLTCLLDLGAAVLALFVLKPLRKKRVSSIAQLSLARTNQRE